MSLKIESKVGITKNGKIIVPHRYDSIEPILVNGVESSVLFKTKIGTKEGVLLYNAEDDSYAYRDGLINVERDFKEGIAIIVDTNQQKQLNYSLIDTELNIVTKKEYVSITPVGKNGNFIAKTLNTIDLLSPSGKILYENITPATVDSEKSEILYITNEDDCLFGLVKADKDNISIVDTEFTSINEFKNGVAIVTMQYDFGLRYGILDIDFNELLEPIYDNIYMLNSELYAVSSKGKYGVYSIPKKKFIVPNEFEFVTLSKTEFGDSIVLK